MGEFLVKHGSGWVGGRFIVVCLDNEQIDQESDGFGIKFLYDDLGLWGIFNWITFSKIDLRNGDFSDYKFIMELVCFCFWISGWPLLKNGRRLNWNQIFTLKGNKKRWWKSCKRELFLNTYIYPSSHSFSLSLARLVAFFSITIYVS